MNLKQYIINLVAGYDVEENIIMLQHRIEDEQHTSSSLRRDVSSQQVTIANLNQQVATSATELSSAKKELKDYQKECEKLDGEKDAAKKELISLQQLYATLRGDADSLRHTNESLRNDLSEKTANLMAFQGRYDSLTNSYNQLADVSADSKARVKELEGELETANENHAALQGRYESLNQSYNELEQEAAGSKARVGELEQYLETANVEKSELLSSIDKAKVTVEGLEKKVADQDYDIKTLTDNWVTASANLAKMTESRDSLQADLTAANANIEKKASELEEKQSELVSLTGRLKELEAEFESKNAIGTATPEEIKALESRIQELEEKIQDKDNEINILQQNIKARENEKDILIKELNELRFKEDLLNDRVNELEEKVRSNERTINQQEKEVQEKAREIAKLKKQVADLLDKVDIDPVPLIDEISQPKPMTEPIPVPVPAPTPSPTPKPPVDDIHACPTKPKGPKVSKESIPNVPVDGGFVDFPPIKNDSAIKVTRTIVEVKDRKNNSIYADDFFENSSAEEIALQARILADAAIKGETIWACRECGGAVKIGKRMINHKESLFFTHVSREQSCPWIHKQTKSIDKPGGEDDEPDEPTDDGPEIEIISKAQQMKNFMLRMLTTTESEELGIEDVKMDTIIRSNLPYMRWRRPDLSFDYNGRRLVIQLQRKKHGTQELADRDIFYRLTDTHIIWVFGADNDVTYDYMRQSNYKNTLFYNHRNVLVFDKEAQEESEKHQTLVLKCNWLDENNEWEHKLAKDGCNGMLIKLSDLTFDNEYCKPYYFNANEPYFVKNPEAKRAYEMSLESREDLKKKLEENWKRDAKYQEALRLMRMRHAKAISFKSGTTWGFRYNDTTLIQPIFTEVPYEINDGYYVVKVDDNYGLVDSYAEIIIAWNGQFKKHISAFFDSHQLVVFNEGNSYGLSDKNGNVLIDSRYEAIAKWTEKAVKVKLNNKWTICDLNGQLLTDYWYDSIEPFAGIRTSAKLTREGCWKRYDGVIDENGNPLSTQSVPFCNGYLVCVFGLWGYRKDSVNVIEPQYDDMTSWTDSLCRVYKENKWGIVNVETGSVVIQLEYDSIGDLVNGVAVAKYMGVSKHIDISGKEVSQQTITLQDGMKKVLLSGKWGILDATGMEIVAPKYDEIGSFRGRLIGVINGHIIKLNAYYNYPIMLRMKYVSSNAYSYTLSVGGVNCHISKAFVTQSGCNNINQILTPSNKGIAFGNLIFSNENYMLRVVKTEHLSKPLSHGDKQDDFSENVIYEGVVSGFKKYRTKAMNEPKVTKAIVKIGADAVTMVPRRFFVAAQLNITEFHIGDQLKLRKIGFDDELDQTIWEIISNTAQNE